MTRGVRTFPKPQRHSSWQVIYMDLMTIMMVFFVILWSLNKGKDDGLSQTVGTETPRMIQLSSDILFPPGQNTMKEEGRKVFASLFQDPEVLEFDVGGLVKRMLVIHGHTDSDGSKAANFSLGYQRALAAYEEIKQHNPELSDHAVICSHADNSPQELVPTFTGKLTPAQRHVLRESKGKNRRITLEDKMVNQFEAE